MTTIKLSPEEAYKYDSTLADVICFLWGYVASEKDIKYNPYYNEMKSIMEDLRNLRLKLKNIYKIKIENKEE